MGIGDPSPMGWLTVACYYLAALLSLKVGLARGTIPRLPGLGSEASFWKGLFVLFIVLGVNKQLDLQSGVTELFRILARRTGFYDSRRSFQPLVLVALGFGGVIALVRLCRVCPRSGPARLALAGSVFIVSFVLIRAVSFHGFDVFLSWRLAGVKMNWAMELGGIASVCLAACLAWKGKAPMASPTGLPAPGLGEHPV